MTDQELKDIVAAVVAELEKSGVDFDYKAEQAEDDDLVFVIRGTAPNYQGVTVTWKGLLDIITAQATQAKNDAVTAKNTANTILTQVQNKGTEITNFVATSKAELETQKNESVNAVKSVYQTDLDAERSAREEADTDHSARIAALESENARQKGEIENLKAKAEGQIYRTEIINAEAYSIDVPSSVAPYAELQKIGGKSVVWNQLVTYGAFKSSEINGLSVVNNGDGSISINGTATATTELYALGDINSIKQITVGHKVFVTIAPQNKVDVICYTKTYGSTGINTRKDSIQTVTASIGFLKLDISNGTAFINEKITLKIFDLTRMFGAGNEPSLEECKKIFSADYYPYDAGTLKSFPVKRVKSVGRNLINVPTKTVSGNAYIFSKSPDVELDYGEYTFSAKFTGSGGFSLWGTDVDSKTLFNISGSFNNDKITRTFNASRGVRKINLYVNAGTTVSEIQIEKGNVVTDYSPYMESTLDLSSVTSEFKSALNAHDEWSNGKVTKRIGAVDLGTLNWEYKDHFGTSTYVFRVKLSDALGVPASKYTNAICPKFVSEKINLIANGIASDKSFGIWDYDDNLIVYDTSYSDASTFKAAMSGVMLYYELATPTEEEADISTFIQVEGGGTLTFESDDTIHMPVPSKDRFVVDLT